MRYWAGRIGLYALSACFLIAAVYIPKLIFDRFLVHLERMESFPSGVVLWFAVKYGSMAVVGLPLLMIAIVSFLSAHLQPRPRKEIGDGRKTGQ